MSYELKFVEVMRRIHRAGIANLRQVNDNSADGCELKPLHERVQKLLGIVNRNKQSIGTMTFFVMYDIENNKVRQYIAKYLLRKGCIRIQKSIFIANVDRRIFTEIAQTLKEVQEVYENKDSILLTPISTDEIQAMKIIGQNIDFDLLTNSRNTLFF